jgi:hypothetical protein
MALGMLATVFAGFARTYYLAGVFQAPLPSLIIHLHGAAFSCWILLLVTQTSLVAAGRVDVHRRLGMAGFLLASLMVMLGVLAATDSLMREAGPAGRASPIFLYHSSNGHADFCDAHLFRDARPFQPPSTQASYLRRHDCAVDCRHRSLAVCLREQEGASGGAGLLQLPTYPGGLRSVVHAQGSSRHDMGRGLPDFRAADSIAHREDRCVAHFRQLDPILGPLGQIKIRPS